MLSSPTQLFRTRLIDLRWLSVTGMLLAAAVSPNVIGGSDLLPRLIAFATFVASLNGCIWLASRLYFGGETPWLSPWAQLLFDIVSWSAFIYLSGGATNPLISVLLPLVAIGAVTLDRRRAWLLGAIAILLYSFLWRFHLPLPVLDAQRASYMHLLGMWLVFVVSTLISIWFIQTMNAALRERDAALAEAREDALRGDWLASVGNLAASAAHEMATPLATLNLLVEEWESDPAFPAACRADLALMRGQLDSCRRSLNHLSHRAQAPASVAEATTADWLRALTAAWQATHPEHSLRVDLAPELASRPARFDITVERAIAGLLDHAGATRGGRLHLQAACTDDRLKLTVDAAAPQKTLADNAPASVDLGTAAAAIRLAGGALRLARERAGPRHSEILLPLPAGES